MNPIGRNILVKRIKEQQGSIEIPDTVLDKHSKALVVKLGTGEHEFDFEVKPGDIVIIDLSLSIPVIWDGEQEDRFIIKHDDILIKYDN